MQLVVSGIKAECPRCKGTEFERARGGSASDEPPILRCYSCSTRHSYGLLLAVVAQRVLDSEARRKATRGR